MFTLKRNGGWCWFQDPRAIMDGGAIVFGSVAGTTKPASAAGDVDITSFDLKTRQAITFTLAPAFQCDDHDVPAILQLSDGRYLAVYQKHGDDPLMRWRISAGPGDVTDWGPEQSADCGARDTYANLFQLPAESGRIYNFHRGFERNPNYMLSDDGGRTFRYGGRLMNWRHPQGSSEGSRPYVRYACNDRDTIHFINTEDHPLCYDNSIYHGFYRGGMLHRSDGSLIGPLATTQATDIGPTSFTRVFAGDSGHIAWTSDIRLDAAGNPRVTFSVSTPQKERGDDIRYWHGRWDGKHWVTNEIAHAGTRLYAREFDYSGLATFDPDDLARVVISTNADPKTGEPLISKADGQRHWEIYRGVTRDGGRTWKWTALTHDSSVDNLRPLVPASSGRGPKVILWLRGTYRSFLDYDQDVVGTIVNGNE